MNRSRRRLFSLEKCKWPPSVRASLRAAEPSESPLKWLSSRSICPTDITKWSICTDTRRAVRQMRRSQHVPVQLFVPREWLKLQTMMSQWNAITMTANWKKAVEFKNNEIRQGNRRKPDGLSRWQNFEGRKIRRYTVHRVCVCLLSEMPAGTHHVCDTHGQVVYMCLSSDYLNCLLNYFPYIIVYTSHPVIPLIKYPQP